MTLNDKKIVILGSKGQVGKALSKHFKNAKTYSHSEIDITIEKDLNKIDWKNYDTLINAAAYVNADHSETKLGRVKCWKVNSSGLLNLSKVAIKNNLTLIHFSTDYVYDGYNKNHNEEEHISPLSVYGQSKAAGDLIVSLIPKHYILRVSWIIGDGHNFVKTMLNLADLRLNPRVVNDQFGRLTFTSEIVRAVDYILKNNVKYGIYNLSNIGPILSWYDIAKETFRLAGHNTNRISSISTKVYMQEKSPFALRPTNSDMDLTKIQNTGFMSKDYLPLLSEYINDIQYS